MRVIAFVSDLWRKRFGWDRGASGGWDIPKDVEPLAHMHCCDYPLPPEIAARLTSLASSSTAPAITVTINALDGREFADLLRSTPAKERP
jgi:hypothetical protein